MNAAKRVLITRAAQQGSALAEEVRSLGLEPVLVPAIETVPPSTFDPLDTALATLGDFDWLVFTSANAVEVFTARLPEPRTALRARIAAIGSATSRALETAGLDVDLVPAQAVAESFTEALLPYAQKQGGQPTRFLLIRAEDGRDYLPDALRIAGADVTVAPAYRTVVAESSVALLRSLFLDGTAVIDAITFTSSSTVRNLLALSEAAQVTLPEQALRISIGPITSQTLREVGLPPHAEAPSATVQALARTVLEALGQRNRE